MADETMETQASRSREAAVLASLRAVSLHVSLKIRTLFHVVSSPRGVRLLNLVIDVYQCTWEEDTGGLCISGKLRLHSKEKEMSK